MSKSHKKDYYVLCWDTETKTYWPLELEPMTFTAAKEAVAHQKTGGFDNCRIYSWDAWKRYFRRGDVLGFLWVSVDALGRGPYKQEVFDHFITSLPKDER